MKISGNASSLPTFRQWRKENWKDERAGYYPIEIIWYSHEFKSITFQTAEFRVSQKFKTGDELHKVWLELDKLRKTPVTAYVNVKEKLEYEVEVTKAGDAHEDPLKMMWIDKMSAFVLEPSRS